MGRSTEEDPRYLRVRGNLVSALLDLAAESPVDELSVSELAAAAGVSRTTFYSHSSSPSQLLADTLISQLQPELDGWASQMSRTGADYTGMWREVYVALLEHVQRHRRIYEGLFSANSSALTSLLDYLETVASRYVDAVGTHFVDQEITPLWRAMAIQQLVHNTVAMIRAWLQTGLEDPPEAVVDTYLTLAPPWQLARPDESGRIRMHRGARRASA